MKIVYSVIVPVYNEEQVLPEFYQRMTQVMVQTNEPYEIIFVNDGSHDKSAWLIYSFAQKDKHIKLISFSRNFGHQAAITAGMDFANGDGIVIIDSDLQDPPEVILQMIQLWQNGYEVIYGKRKKRSGETYFKKMTAKLFYRTLNRMTTVDIPVDTGDFRFIDRKVNEAMKKLREKNRYMRGLVSWVGFKQTALEYERHERFAGITKYPLQKMIRFAIDGITSFSYVPLRFATTLGFFLSLLSFIYLLIIVYQRLFTDTTITGWASIVGVVLLSQGIVLMILGLMGEYIGRIYEESKGRPIYIVREIIGYENEENHDKNDSNDSTD